MRKKGQIGSKVDYHKRVIQRLFISIILFISLILVGTLGYIIIEGAHWFDALFMTVISATTVGYGEIVPLSAGGRIFTMLLLFTSVGLLTYSITSITSLFLDGDFKNYIKERQMEKVLNELKDHVIICGFGRLGHAVSMVLEKKKIPFLVVEKNIEKLKMHKDKNLIFIEGNATDDDILDMLGIERAQAFVATLPSDAENVFLVLSAREKNKKITIYTRASDPENVNKLRMAGANEVILPEHIGGAYIANRIVSPEILDYDQFFNKAVEK